MTSEETHGSLGFVNMKLAYFAIVAVVSHSGWEMITISAHTGPREPGQENVT